MPSLQEAQRIVLDSVGPMGAETVPALEAVGRVLAEDVLAPWDLPWWDNSAMDGYAVRAAEAARSGALPVAGFLPAGAPGAGRLPPGAAIRILTGAPLPDGADAVVPQEEVEAEPGGARGSVRFLRPVRPGAHVRRKGEDIRAGEQVLPAGTVLGPAQVSALASFSRLSVPVVRRPRVAILSTGDELVPPGAPLAPGQIHDSNSWALAAAALEAGALPTLLGIARDEREPLRALLAEGLRADALVTSAGVSVGDRDHVREVLEELGVRAAFWKVDIKPGRPTAFALRGATPVFSLPGNPVSSLLTFEEIVRPALRRMLGHAACLRHTERALLSAPLPHKPGRLQLVRVRLERRDGRLLAASAGSQDTGILKTALLAHGIALVPAEAGDLPAGAEVEVQVLREPPAPGA